MTAHVQTLDWEGVLDHQMCAVQCLLLMVTAVLTAHHLVSIMLPVQVLAMCAVSQLKSDPQYDARACVASIFNQMHR